MTADQSPETLTVKRAELVEASEPRTKMKRAPNGVQATGLRDAALIPAIGGFRVEMPGGAHFVWAISGKLSTIVRSHPKFADGLLKVLTSRTGETASISVTSSHIEFRCEGSKVVVPILAEQVKKPSIKQP